MPAFIPISFLIGPLTTAGAAHDVVLLWRAVMPLAASARMTGRYWGFAPAMTALTATFSTVYSQNSRKRVGRIRPTISSGLRRVPFSIAATRSSVGSTIGRWSVQWFSSNSRCRFSSLSGANWRGVERSNETPCRSASVSGLISPSSKPCMNGRLLTGSWPSM